MLHRGRQRFRRTDLQLIGFIGVLVGLWQGYDYHFFPTPWYWLLLIPIAVLWRRRSAWLVICISLLAVSIGCARGSHYSQQLNEYEPFYNQKTTLLVTAMNDGTYSKTKQMSVDANHVRLLDGSPLPGKVAIGGFGMNAIFQGDEILVSGKLRPGYGAYQGTISFGQLELVKHQPNLIADIRRRFAAAMQSALPEPLAPFVMGLLIGQRTTLPEQTKNDLLKVGLTHIIAVSGYNLTIILHASRRLLGKKSKRISTFLTLVLIAIFLLIAGSSASIVRAAIVSVFSIWAAYYGRVFRPLNVLLLAAALTAYVNPVYIWNDLSWYLSFLAFAGIMIVGPLLHARLPEQLHNSVLIAVGLESISAEVATLPFMLYIFGQMSFISLIANILVTTLVPLAMLLGFAAGLAGMFAAGAAGWAAWPAKLLLTYMLDTAHILAGLPHIFRENIGFSLPQMVFTYAVTITVLYLLAHKTKEQKSATITDKRLNSRQGVAVERTQQMVNN